MDLNRDLKNIVNDQINELESITSTNLNINDEDVNDPLKKFLTIIYKLIVPRKPRNVKYSEELKAKISNNEISDEHLNALNTIKKKFEEGEDITPYLSDKALKPDEQDGMLFDWRIHHLHLSNTRNNYFYDRSSYQLFFYYDPEIVYFIDAKRHPLRYEWADDNVVSIFEKNWPEIFEPYHMPYFSAAEPLSSEERYKFRANGIFPFLYINNKVFMPPGGGFVTDKSSTAVVELKNRIIHQLRIFTDSYNSNPEYIKNLLNSQGHTLEPLEFRLVLKDDNLMILEETNEAFIPLGIPFFEIK